MARRKKSVAPSSPPVPPPSLLNPPDPARPYFWFSCTDQPNTRRRMPYECQAGIPLPPAADFYAYPGDLTWTGVLRDNPDDLLEPIADAIYDESLVTLADFQTHALFASKNLTFCFLPTATASPLIAQHPDEPTALFWRVDLTFLGWVRSICKRCLENKRTLSQEQKRAVDRVWSYVCWQNGITDSDHAKLPTLVDALPSSAAP